MLNVLHPAKDCTMHGYQEGCGLIESTPLHSQDSAVFLLCRACNLSARRRQPMERQSCLSVMIDAVLLMERVQQGCGLLCRKPLTVKLHFTGHSWGGTQAMVAALRLATALPAILNETQRRGRQFELHIETQCT